MSKTSIRSKSGVSPEQENRRRRYSKAMWNVAARYNQESKQINGAETVVKRTGKRRDSQSLGLN